MNTDVRACAARVVASVMSGTSLNRALPEALTRVEAQDRALLQELCYGTLRMGPRLQAILAQLLDKPLRERDADVQALLLCGLYQLDEMRIPDHASVDSTVNATRFLQKKWARGLTNAILRRYLRERQSLPESLDEAAALAHPQWFYRLLGQQWPADRAAVIAANNGRAPMTLRVNERQQRRDEYLALLCANQVPALAGALSAQAVQLLQPRDVADLPGFAEGRASVQDEAAQVAAHLLQAAPGERILDACAAPGGKACHILELQPELTELVAMDVDAARLQKVEENLHRLGLKATLLRGDAAHPPTQLQASSFDRILVDAPCSASGVIRRHPDVKWLRLESDLASLAAQQEKILQGLWPLLKVGGSLLYATCSIFEQENSQVVSGFLEQYQDATLVDIDLDSGHDTGHGWQILPRAQGPDGLFYALLHKNG